MSIWNNNLTDLNFLDTLPNKDNLKGVNLFGNQIAEVDFAELFTKFPNLESINLANNPISAKNLNNLTSEQFNKLVQGIKNKKIRVDSFKGTVLVDLLDYTQRPTIQGDNQQQQETAQYLQTLISNSPTKSVSRQNSPNDSNFPLLIGGLTIFGISLLAIGYLWGKRKKHYE